MPAMRPARDKLLPLGVMVILCGCAPTGRPIAADPAAPRSERKAPAGDGVDAARRADAASQTMAQGEKLFGAYCAPCHQRGGQGVEGRVPPLDDSPWVAGSEDRLIRIVLNGLHGPIEIQGETYNLEMPAFRVLFKDDDIASILTYVRRRYGAPSSAVSKDAATRVRRETEQRKGYWTVDELLAIP